MPSAVTVALSLLLLITQQTSSLPAGQEDHDEHEHALEQARLQEQFGIRLAGPMYVNLPIVSPLLVVAANSSGEEGRPSFSHVYSMFDAAQKGCDPRRPGTWFRHQTVTLVLSYHHGCPVRIYKISDGAITSELLGNPAENPAFRPTVVLWAGSLQSVESLCEHMYTLVSYVSVTGWTLEGSENIEAEEMLALHPENAPELSRLAEPAFNADQSPLAADVYSGPYVAQ